MTTPGLIYKKMAAILADTTAITKGKKNVQQGFMFRGIDDVMNELHNTFATHAVFLTTKVLEIRKKDRPTKSGGSMLHQFQKIKFTFHAEDGSSVSSIVWGESMDSGDKSGNKCMSIALKYCLLQAFLIPTEDMIDPDAEVHQLAGKQNNSKAKEEKAPATANNQANNPETELYTGTKVQKDILKKFFLDIGLKDADRPFMAQVSEECQRMPLVRVYDYIRPKAAAYLHAKLAEAEPAF